MFAGHVGVALAFGRVERRVNVGVFLVAALLLDILLWIFVLLGAESVRIPADFGSTHQAEFAFPVSHGLLAALAWSGLMGTAVCLFFSWRKRTASSRTSFLVAAAVFSHWLLDALVHRPELPIVGADSPKVGLGLWNELPVALAIEAALVAGGLLLFVSGSQLSRRSSAGLVVLNGLILVFTVAGMTIAPPPPSPFAMAASSLVTLAAVCALVFWLGKLEKPRHPVA